MTPVGGALDWDREGQQWPLRETSRFVRSGHLVWHVQVLGPENAPACLLVHGTGAASHSFRGLAPLLAKDWRVFVPDLPGHGFTRGTRRRDLTLPGMATALSGLLATIDRAPAICIGHSAGTAILLHMCLEGQITPRKVFGINSALEAIPGNSILSPLAKILFFNPFTSDAVALHARLGGLVTRLLKGTGSTIDRDGIDCYRLLISHPSHVKGALGMMANWDLDPLIAKLSHIQTPVNLISAADDPMVPARVSRSAARYLPSGQAASVKHGGHLVHEVDPGVVFQIIRDDLNAPAAEPQNKRLAKKG